MIKDNSIELKYESLKVGLMYIEYEYRDYYKHKKLTDEDYEKYYKEVIYEVNRLDIDYSNITARNDSKKITWEYIQSTDNSYEKFVFAKKVSDRIIITANHIENINLLLQLGFIVCLITNVENFYFSNLTKEEAIKKSLESGYKRFPAIFKKEIKALAMDYRKFYDINRFSKESFCDDKDIRITQEQGLEFVEISNLICNNKLKEALDKVVKIGAQVKDVPWLV